MEGKDATTLKVVPEKESSRKEAEEEKNMQIYSVEPHLAEDCISNILLRLPIESLRRSILVSKPWYSFIKSSAFVNSHLSRSENVLIFVSKAIQETSHLKEAKSVFQENPNTCTVEAMVCGLPKVPVLHPLLNPRFEFRVRFMEIRDGKSRIGDFNLTCFGRIRASCNGLVLLENTLKKGGLVVMNPITREFSTLPLGTLCLPQNESYGFSFCSSTSQYKLVHLFRDEMLYMGCEILDIRNRSWKVVDGPPPAFFKWLGYNPVSAIGALHWVPDAAGSYFIVSMSMDQEKFHKVPLPTSMKTRDRLVEMRGLLCFVAHKDVNQFDIWVLRSLCEDKWTKYQSVNVGCLVDVVPLYCTRMSSQMIFQGCRDKSLFAYDFRFKDTKEVDTKEVEMGENWFRFVDGCYMPHVNSLVSFGNSSRT